MTTQPLPVHIKSATTTVWVALALGWSTDLLFYGKQAGISMLLFALLLVGALMALGNQEKVRPAWRNMWLLLPLFFFATMVFLRANPFLTALNVLATLSLLSYVAFFYANSHVPALGIVGAMTLPARVAGNGFLDGFNVATTTFNTKSRQNYNKQHLYPILRGILLATPVLIVFTILLASADLIFADYIENAFKLNFISDLFEYGWRAIFIGLMAWVFGGTIMFAIGRANAEDDAGWVETLVTYLPQKYALGLTETVTLLVLVNGLFMVFAGIQFTYLFGGQQNITLNGFTFAEYARQGFFELVAVAVLTLGMILMLNWITRRENKKQIKLFNALATLMVGFVVVMLVSAWHRMNLYEATYGYTELRLYTYTFMAWLGVVLLWFVATLWQKPHFFAIGLILAAMGFLATLNLINPDAFIAKQNLARYQQTGDLDVAYLVTLSDDAIPELLHGLALTKLDTKEVETGACRLDYLETGADYDGCTSTRPRIIESELQSRLDKRVENKDWRQWQSFHLSRWWGFQRLDSHFNGQGN